MIPVRLPIQQAIERVAKGSPSHLDTLLGNQLAFAGIKGFMTQFRAIPEVTQPVTRTSQPLQDHHDDFP
jgi:hypothetical protein